MSTNSSNQTHATDADRLAGLLSHHRAKLRQSGLTDETIKAAGIVSETTPAKLAVLLGWRKPMKGLAPALVFPFTDADGRNGYCRIRPDNPRKIKGKPVKYESPRGQPNRVYLPTGVAPLLADASGELLVTEGELKALAATQEKFTCIGLVGAFGWKDKGREALLPELERINWNGRQVRIVFDSDLERKPDVQGAETRFAKLLTDRGAKVRCVRLPDGPPDATGEPTKMGLDDFLVAHGRAELRKLLDSAIEPEPVEGAEGKANAASLDPATEATAYLETGNADGVLRLRFWRGGWWLWSRGRYAEVPPSEITAYAVRHLNQGYRQLTTSIVGNVVQQLKAQALLTAAVEPPAWIEGADGWVADEILIAKNGMIHLPSIAAGEKSARPLTPKFFSTTALDYAFDADAPCPAGWLTFLNQLWPDDPQSIGTLQEFIGYLLTLDTRQQKMLLIVGPKRSGKGTIARVIRALVGTANVAGPTLASLATNFGLWPLLGKSVAIISDARLSGRTDQAIVVERLLSISGEDALTCDRKNLEPVTAKLSARFVILTNELPRLGDSSGALAGRIVLLCLQQSFFGREDIALTGKLLGELPGILLWGIEGWRRLRERGHFQQPESASDLAEQMNDLSSPVGQFVRDCCLLGPYRTPTDDLYGAWKEFCEKSGRKEPGLKETFARDLVAAVPELRSIRPREGTDRWRGYEGIAIKSG